MEKWKNAPHPFNENYLISNYGRIKSLKSGKFLTSYLNKNRGYYYISLQKTTNKKLERKNFILHRIVAKLFCYNDNPNIKNQIDHKDFNKKNNKAINLEWVTSKENHRRLWSSGRVKGTIKNTKLSQKDVINIYYLFKNGFSQLEISTKYKIKPCSVSLICSGKRWKELYIKNFKDSS